MKLKTKVMAIALAGSTAGLFGVTGLTNAAQACGSAQGANVFPGGSTPVYTSGQPAAGPTQTGYVGVAGSQGGNGGYLQATGTAGSSGVTGNVTGSGSFGGQGGTVAVGNDGNEAGGPIPANPANVAACQG